MNKEIENNYGLIYMVINKWFSYYKKDYMNDMFNAGVEYLIKGLNNYDPTKGYSKSSYLTSMIRGGITYCINEIDGLNRTGKNHDIYYYIQKRIKQLSLDNVSIDNIYYIVYEEIVKDISHRLDLFQYNVMWNIAIGNGSSIYDGEEENDSILDKKTHYDNQPEKMCIEKDIISIIYNYINTLKEKKRSIYNQYIQSVIDGDRIDFASIGRQFNVSRQYVRTVVNECNHRLRIILSRK